MRFDQTSAIQKSGLGAAVIAESNLPMSAATWKLTAIQGYYGNSTGHYNHHEKKKKSENDFKIRTLINVDNDS